MVFRTLFNLQDEISINEWTAFSAKSPEATYKRQYQMNRETQYQEIRPPEGIRKQIFRFNQKYIKLNCVRLTHSRSYDKTAALLLGAPGSSVGFIYKKEIGARRS
jgi:hypothetical protein